MLFHKLYSSVLGIGYLKGGGTYAAAIFAGCWYLAWNGVYPPVFLSVSVTLLITFLGVWSSAIMETVWGKDPSKVVIDEVAGMAVSLLLLPDKVKYLLCAFVLFRFFDIVKPLFIRRAELLPGGWGIMFDDILSGIYANILVQAFVWLKLF